MRRNWEVGPRKKRWESVQVAVDDVRGNRANRPTNDSDDGVHRTGCVALKTSKVHWRCSPRWLLGRQMTRIFGFGLLIRKEDPGWDPVRPESLRPSTDSEGRRARFSCFSLKPDENRRNPVIFGSLQFLRVTQELAHILARSGIVAGHIEIHVPDTVPPIPSCRTEYLRRPMCVIRTRDHSSALLGRLLPTHWASRSVLFFFRSGAREEDYTSR